MLSLPSPRISTPQGVRQALDAVGPDAQVIAGDHVPGAVPDEDAGPVGDAVDHEPANLAV